jgi:hypothetical protein
MKTAWVFSPIATSGIKVFFGSADARTERSQQLKCLCSHLRILMPPQAEGNPTNRPVVPTEVITIALEMGAQVAPLRPGFDVFPPRRATGYMCLALRS